MTGAGGATPPLSARRRPHLRIATSTPAEFRFQSAAFHEWSGRAVATGAPEIVARRMIASDRPGSGVVPLMDVLGGAVAVIS